jgi:uncharacterized repeat protein (TIGR03803 family)
MLNHSLKRCGALVALLIAAMSVSSARADGIRFSTLYAFQAPAPTTYASPLGSQPDTRPVLGPGNTVYGMTYDGGVNGNGVIYRYDLGSHQYTLLHTFSALDANGDNKDGANPGVAITRGPGDVFYGTASFGGANGTGTIFSITASGGFTVLHTFSATDANGHNLDGAYPLRTVVIGRDGNLYGTTRLGGENTCSVPGFSTHGCGVAWVMDRWGKNFRVLHQFTATEGHAASVIQACDGLLYGSAVWPFTMSPTGVLLPSRILFRMSPSGQNFEVLYRFSQTDTNGANTDGADPYEPLVETQPGVFYGAAYRGGTNSNGVVFRYSLSNPKVVQIVHDFSAVNSAGENEDGAGPDGRLTPGPDGALYSNSYLGGMNGNGVIYAIRPDGSFEVLYTFSLTNPTTGANKDGANPDDGVILDQDHDSLIGIANYGGKGSSAGPSYSGGTLYRLRLDGSISTASGGF